MYFPIFQREDMLKLYLSFKESQPIYAYKHMFLKKE